MEFFRKGVHLLVGLLLLGVYFVAGRVSHDFALFCLALVVGAQLVFELLRLDSSFLPKRSWLLRHQERNRMAGHIFFTLGILLSLAVFEARVAVAAVLMLLFGDSASMLGQRLGSRKVFRRKTLESIISELFANVLVGALVLRSGFLSGPVLWLPVLGMSVAATFVEVWSDKVDDNLSIPLFAGLVGQLLMFLT